MKIRFLNLGLRALTLAVKFAFILALAIFLSPEQVGLYGLITVTVFYSTYLVGFEFYTFSTRDLVGRPKSEWAHFLSSQLVFFGLMYVIVLPVSSFLFWVEVLPWNVMTSFLVLIVLEHLSTELMRLLIAIEKPLLATFIVFVKQALWAICFTLAMWLNPDFRNLPDLLIFWISGTFVSILFGAGPLLVLNWKGALEKIDWDWIRNGVVVAIPLLISSVAVRSLFTFDRYAFEYLNGLTLLGAYSVYMGVASAMLSFMDSGVFVFYYPKMMRLYREGNLYDFKSIYLRLIKQSTLWLSFLMFGAILTGAFVFPMLDEKVYEESLGLFILVVVAMAVFIAGYVFQYGLYATRRDRSIIFSNVAGLLVAALTLLVLAQYTEYWAVTLSMLSGGVAATLLKYRKWLATQKELRLV